MLNKRHMYMSIHNLARKQFLFISSKTRQTKMETEAEIAKRNIEIKARIADEIAFNESINVAKKLTQTDGEILPQHDVFFKVPNGRLKLRMQPHKSMLIQYNRPDIPDAKLSEFSVLDVTEPKKLEKMLRTSLGVLGEVKKTRYLYIYEQTRIHLDNVEGLGTFLEFKVCLRPEQTVEDGTVIANQLMETFNIEKSDLLNGAYMDELLQK